MYLGNEEENIQTLAVKRRVTMRERSEEPSQKGAEKETKKREKKNNLRHEKEIV